MNELSFEDRARGRLTRRVFIKHFVVGTAFSTFLGQKWFATILADCVAVSPTGGILRIKLSDFAALQNENGSVRLDLNPFTENGPTAACYPVPVHHGCGTQVAA